MSSRSEYVELRSRSAFSFLEGASPPEELAEGAGALGYDAIALGDRDGLYGAPRFYQAATNAGVTASMRAGSVPTTATGTTRSRYLRRGCGPGGA